MNDLEIVDVTPASETKPASEPKHVRSAPVAQPDTPVQQQVQQQVNGESMIRLSNKRMSAVQAARLAGIVPFTILNFNPVIAQVENGNIDYHVEPAGSKLGIQKKLRFGSEFRPCSVLVVSNERGYPVITDCSSKTGKNTPTAEYDWHVMLPIEQVRLFEFEYNHQTNPGTMGGVLVFKGGFDALPKSADGVIHVPEVQRLADNTLSYFAKAVPLGVKLTEVLERQKAYCFRKMETANTWFHDPRPEFQGSIDPSFHTWGQFAIDRGWRYREELPWMLSRDPAQVCKACGKQRQSGTALFCSCGIPFDPYSAYMAGYQVDAGLLASLPAEQQSAIEKEAKRRRQFAATLEGDQAKKQA